MASFAFWAASPDDVAAQQHSSVSGLNQQAAQEILDRVGPNRIRPEKQATPSGLLFSQFKRPVVLILISATGISAFPRDWVNAAIITADCAGQHAVELLPGVHRKHHQAVLTGETFPAEKMPDPLPENAEAGSNGEEDLFLGRSKI